MDQNLLLATTLIIFSVNVILCEEFTCPRSRGYYPHPTDCKKYYSCRKRVSTLIECPEEMLFDVKKGNCYINSAVDCGNRKKPTVTVVTRQVINEETRTDQNWNTNLHIVTETNMASTRDSSSMLPLKDNTREITTSSNGNEFNLTTIQTDNSNYPTAITRIPDNKPDTSEFIVDDSNYTVSETSTDSEQKFYTTASDLDNNNEIFSVSTQGNEVTAEGGLNTTSIASTESDMKTSGEHVKPLTTEDGLYDITMVSTDSIDSSTASSWHIVDDSNYTTSETWTDSKQDDNYTTASTRGNERGTDEGEFKNVTSIATTESDTRTSREHEKPETTEDELNDTSIVFTDFLNNSTVSSWSHPNIDYTDSVIGNGTSDAKIPSTVTTESTTKRINEFSVSYLFNITDDSTFTIDRNEKSSTLDKENIVIDWSNRTDYDENTGKFNELSTIASNGTDLPYKENITTVKEFISSTTSGTEATVVSDRIEINTTSSNEETTGSIDVKETDDVDTTSSTEPQFRLSTKMTTTEQSTFITGTTVSKEPDDITIHSSTEPAPILSTKKGTTKQSTTTIDDYYENDFDCPTAYGRYPHPTDKHKFLHCQEWYPHVMVCPADLIFDEKLEICVWTTKSFIVY